MIDAIREKYKWTTLIRDGAYGPISVGPEMDSWNRGKGRQMFMAKWSAGCSMSESPNDLGHMHQILHALFSNADFKCRVSADPPGTYYRALKAYLQKHLAPASFQTFWRCICSMEAFMNKAFSQFNVQSAWRAGGINGDIVDAPTIMGHNPSFANLPDSKASNLLRLIDAVFVPYWWQHGLVHEWVFEEVFSGVDNIDTINQGRAGKPLNAMATNRQRFLMDNHSCWKEELQRRREAEEYAQAEKQRKAEERQQADMLRPAKNRQCCQPGCVQFIDITTSSMKRSNEKTWRKCRGKGCRFWGCTEHHNVVGLHENACQKWKHDMDQSSSESESESE